MKKSSPQTVVTILMAAIIGSILAFVGGRWIVLGRIDYWLGPTEKHHVLASPKSSPIIYWTLVFVFCAGAIALWVKIIIDVTKRMRPCPGGRAKS